MGSGSGAQSATFGYRRQSVATASFRHLTARALFLGPTGSPGQVGEALERWVAARAAASSSTFARAPVPGGIFVEVGATFFSCAVPDRIEAIKSSRSPPLAGARTGTDGLLAWGGGGAGGSGGAGGGGGAAMGGGGGGGGGGAPPPTIGGGSGGGGGAPTPMAGGCGGASGTDEGPGMGGGTGGWPTSGGGDGRLAGGAVAGRGGAGGGDGGRASTTGGGAMRGTGGGGMPGTGGGR